MSHWLQLLAQLGPIVLAATPLSALAPAVVAGIAAAEGLPGATGPQKKEIVKQIVSAAAQGANAQVGRTIIDPALAVDSASHVIDTIVNITNIVHQAHDDATPIAPDVMPPAAPGHVQ